MIWFDLVMSLAHEIDIFEQPTSLQFGLAYELVLLNNQ